MFLEMSQVEDRAEYGLGAVADDSSIASRVVGVRLKEEGRKKKVGAGEKGKRNGSGRCSKPNIKGRERAVTKKLAGCFLNERAR
jgi:hypothetical protein